MRLMKDFEKYLMPVENNRVQEIGHLQYHPNRPLFYRIDNEFLVDSFDFSVYPTLLYCIVVQDLYDLFCSNTKLLNLSLVQRLPNDLTTRKDEKLLHNMQ